MEKTSIKTDNVYVLQITLVVLKLVGIPHFAEAGWEIIFFPLIVSLVMAGISIIAAIVSD